MKSFQDSSIKRKLTAVSFLTTGATLLLAGLGFAFYGVRGYREALVRQLSTQAEIIGLNATSALVFGDERSAAETLAALRAEPQVAFAGVYTPDGRPFATYRRAGAPTLAAAEPQRSPPEGVKFTADALEVVHLVGTRERPLGSVMLRADLTELRGRIKAYVGIGAIVLTVSLVACLVIASTLQKMISDPVRELAAVARTIAFDKNYGVRAAARHRDELGLLVEAFNEMLDQIQRRDAELQGMNQTLSQRTDELGRKNEEVEAFVYIVSHDLRGPLVNLQGFCQELQKSSDALAKELGDVVLPPEKAKEIQTILETDIPEALRFISASTNKFERLINALLRLSRLGRQEYRIEPLDMNALLTTTLDSLRQGIENRGADVVAGNLPRARGDLTAAGQVLSNLIQNALRYLQPGRPGRIEIGGTREGALCRYWVSDNGAGISQSAMKKLFQVFQRFHPDLAEGEGIGLATVKRLVERLGGRVWAESVEGVGTTFLFTLPALEADPGGAR